MIFAGIVAILQAEPGAQALRTRARARTLIGLGALLGLAILVSSTVGGVSLSMAQVVAILLHRAGIAVAVSWSPQQEAVLLAIRLPRVVLAVLVGAGLGASGAAMQGVFRNPLVDPGLLGVSSGAALAAVAVLVVGQRWAHGLPPSLAPYALSAAAFLGSLAAMELVQRVAQVDGRTQLGTLLLAGIAVNALCGALIGLFTYLANDAQLRSVTFWSLGSLGGASWRIVLAVAPLIALPILALGGVARSLNALLLGERDARHLGVDAESIKRWIVRLVAVVVGASVAVCGVLGFVGLVVPHLLRLLAGPDHRLVLPGSALLGASLLLGADALARSLVVPAELPLGVVTAFIGAPLFLFLLVRERRHLA